MPFSNVILQKQLGLARHLGCMWMHKLDGGIRLRMETQLGWLSITLIPIKDLQTQAWILVDYVDE